MAPEKSNRKSSDLKIEMVEGPEVTEQEVGTIVQILFQWWRRGIEEVGAETDKEESGPRSQ